MFCQCVGGVISDICDFVCQCSKRKMTWAINTKHSSHTLLQDQEIKRSKVKVTGLWSVQPAWVCMSIRLLRFLVNFYHRNRAQLSTCCLWGLRDCSIPSCHRTSQTTAGHWRTLRHRSRWVWCGIVRQWWRSRLWRHGVRCRQRSDMTVQTPAVPQTSHHHLIAFSIIMQPRYKIFSKIIWPGMPWCCVTAG